MGNNKVTNIQQFSELNAEILRGDWEYLATYAERIERVFSSENINDLYSYVEYLDPQLVAYVDYSDIILKDRLQTLLYQMKQLTKKQNSVLNQFEQKLHSFFTLLYGLCSGLTSFIFNAFTGASLARILS